MIEIEIKTTRPKEIEKILDQMTHDKKNLKKFEKAKIIVVYKKTDPDRFILTISPMTIAGRSLFQIGSFMMVRSIRKQLKKHDKDVKVKELDWI